jgi:hypothetical protein
MSDTAKLCADCHHLRIHPKIQRHGPICGSTAFAPDLVTGEPVRNCSVERTMPHGTCGTAGNLFEPRNDETFVVWVSRPGLLLDFGFTA